MVDIESALRPLVDDPESAPLPVTEIAARARRRRRRRRSVASAAALCVVAVLGARMSLDSTADTTTVDRPTPSSAPTTASPPTTAPSTSVPTTTAPTTSTSRAVPPPGPVNPFDRLEAEAPRAPGGVTTVAGGDHLAFDDVDFGTSLATRFEARVASGVGPGVEGTIEVRLDDLASPPFATIRVTGTGSWTTFTTLAADTPAIGGTHDLYVTFSSLHPTDFATVDWFRFRR